MRGGSLRFNDSDWQGNFGYWQSGFIHANLMMIGYHAWKGFLQSGRGIVDCTVDAKIIHSSTAITDLVPFQIQFISQTQIPDHPPIGSLEPDVIEMLLQVVQTYNPHREAIMLLAAGRQAEFTLLQNMAIAPSECYDQVCNRWEEFEFSPSQRV
ncbi:hypothetical protein TUMEXPCC7403_06675 [Tumidithrix helvetica PCC 7403]|uniref:hypothetical protein n=1 Tax=Tumidithrix helvetica TaxID=3457545 RepID=UPI003C86AA8F